MSVSSEGSGNTSTPETGNLLTPVYLLTKRIIPLAHVPGLLEQALAEAPPSQTLLGFLSHYCDKFQVILNLQSLIKSSAAAFTNLQELEDVLADFLGAAVIAFQKSDANNRAVYDQYLSLVNTVSAPSVGITMCPASAIEGEIGEILNYFRKLCYDLDRTHCSCKGTGCCTVCVPPEILPMAASLLTITRRIKAAVLYSNAATRFALMKIVPFLRYFDYLKLCPCEHDTQWSKVTRQTEILEIVSKIQEQVSTLSKSFPLAHLRETDPCQVLQLAAHGDKDYKPRAIFCSKDNVLFETARTLIPETMQPLLTSSSPWLLTGDILCTGDHVTEMSDLFYTSEDKKEYRVNPYVCLDDFTFEDSKAVMKKAIENDTWDESRPHYYYGAFHERRVIARFIPKDHADLKKLRLLSVMHPDLGQENILRVLDLVPIYDEECERARSDITKSREMKEWPKLPTGELRALMVVYEYVDSVSLAEILSDDSGSRARLFMRRNLPGLLNVLREMAVILDNVHRHGIVHGAVVPGSIWIEFDRMKVTLGEMSQEDVCPADVASTPAGRMLDVISLIRALGPDLKESIRMLGSTNSKTPESIVMAKSACFELEKLLDSVTQQSAAEDSSSEPQFPAPDGFPTRAILEQDIYKMDIVVRDDRATYNPHAQAAPKTKLRRSRRISTLLPYPSGWSISAHNAALGNGFTPIGVAKEQILRYVEELQKAKTAEYVKLSPDQSVHIESQSPFVTWCHTREQAVIQDQESSSLPTGIVVVPAEWFQRTKLGDFVLPCFSLLSSECKFIAAKVNSGALYGNRSFSTSIPTWAQSGAEQGSSVILSAMVTLGTNPLLVKDSFIQSCGGLANLSTQQLDQVMQANNSSAVVIEWMGTRLVYLRSSWQALYTDCIPVVPNPEQLGTAIQGELRLNLTIPKTQNLKRNLIRFIGGSFPSLYDSFIASPTAPLKIVKIKRKIKSPVKKAASPKTEPESAPPPAKASPPQKRQLRKNDTPASASPSSAGSPTAPNATPAATTTNSSNTRSLRSKSSTPIEQTPHGSPNNETKEVHDTPTERACELILQDVTLPCNGDHSGLTLQQLIPIGQRPYPIIVAHDRPLDLKIPVISYFSCTNTAVQIGLPASPPSQINVSQLASHITSKYRDIFSIQSKTTDSEARTSPPSTSQKYLDCWLEQCDRELAASFGTGSLSFPAMSSVFSDTSYQERDVRESIFPYCRLISLIFQIRVESRSPPRSRFTELEGLNDWLERIIEKLKNSRNYAQILQQSLAPLREQQHVLHLSSGIDTENSVTLEQMESMVSCGQVERAMLVIMSANRSQYLKARYDDAFKLVTEMIPQYQSEHSNTFDFALLSRNIEALNQCQELKDDFTPEDLQRSWQFLSRIACRITDELMIELSQNCACAIQTIQSSQQLVNEAIRFNYLLHQRNIMAAKLTSVEGIDLALDFVARAGQARPLELCSFLEGQRKTIQAWASAIGDHIGDICAQLPLRIEFSALSMWGVIGCDLIKLGPNPFLTIQSFCEPGAEVAPQQTLLRAQYRQQDVILLGVDVPAATNEKMASQYAAALAQRSCTCLLQVSKPCFPRLLDTFIQPINNRWRVWMVYKPMDGEVLQNWILSARRTSSDVRRVISSLLGAISELHQCGFPHGRINEGSVFVKIDPENGDVSVGLEERLGAVSTVRESDDQILNMLEDRRQISRLIGWLLVQIGATDLQQDALAQGLCDIGRDLIYRSRDFTLTKAKNYIDQLQLPAPEENA